MMLPFVLKDMEKKQKQEINAFILSICYIAVSVKYLIRVVGLKKILELKIDIWE